MRYCLTCSAQLPEQKRGRPRVYSARCRAGRKPNGAVKRGPQPPVGAQTLFVCDACPRTTPVEYPWDEVAVNMAKLRHKCSWVPA